MPVSFLIFDVFEIRKLKLRLIASLNCVQRCHCVPSNICVFHFVPVPATMATALPCIHYCSISSSFRYRLLPSNSFIMTSPTNFQLGLCSKHFQSFKHIASSLSTVDSPLISHTDGKNEEKSPLLKVTDLTAVIAETKQEILKGVNLVVNEGEVCLKLQCFAICLTKSSMMNI